MKKDIALLLASALPLYTKSNGANRRIDPKTGANSFCIGGVLINLFAAAHPALAAKETNPHSFMGTNSDLPQAVRTWAGVKNSDMTFVDSQRHKIGSGSYLGLRHANDGGGYSGTCHNKPNPMKGASFEEIATWLTTGENYALI